MSLLPTFLKLDGRRCLVVGAGTVALDKIGSLLKTGARLRVVAPYARFEVHEMADAGTIELIQRPFEMADLNGNYLVIAATDSPEVNAEVYRGALERGMLCNSVDDIPNCDFFFGSVVKRGELQIAISTAGESPAFAQRLRREIDEQLPADLGPWLEKLGELRREVLDTHPRGEERRLLLHELAQRQICDSPFCASRRLAKIPSQITGERHEVSGHDFSRAAKETRLTRALAPAELLSPGKVYLVGAGPGDPDLLTVKALRLIQSADVILHDDLVSQAILDLAAPNAEIANVGKRCGIKNITQDEINELMVEHARAGHSVVRLKSGDPLIFGRAAEEMAALGEAGVAFEIVSGITAAFAAAAAVGCSLTDRNSASNVIFSTGHHAQSHAKSSLLASEDATRVVYMPGRDLSQLAQEWIEQGLPLGLPCAVVSRAAQPDQQIHCTTLADLGDAAPTQAPSLLIAGWAVRQIAGESRSEDDAVSVAAR